MSGFHLSFLMRWYSHVERLCLQTKPTVKKLALVVTKQIGVGEFDLIGPQSCSLEPEQHDAYSTGDVKENPSDEKHSNEASQNEIQDIEETILEENKNHVIHRRGCDRSNRRDDNPKGAKPSPVDDPFFKLNEVGQLNHSSNRYCFSHLSISTDGGVC